MTLPRHFHRLRTIACMVLSLLLSQLTWASYVCPAQAESAAMAEMTAAGLPCEGMDAAQPALCHQHATGALLSFEAAKLPAASLPMILQSSALPLSLLVPVAVTVPTGAVADTHPPPDPVFLATLRLRV